MRDVAESMRQWLVAAALIWLGVALAVIVIYASQHKF
jgi:hypothetical protein